ncbi:MAG: SixA phosphatase family protein [Acidimicrobiia bacterium]
MKTVMLLRHGKSDWASDTGSDRDRPLAKRGQRAARLIGEMLAEAGLMPAAAVTSPAVRAHTTLELAMKAGGWMCPVQVSEALYGEGPFAVLEELTRQPDEAARLLLVGHEPTWSEVTGLLVGGGNHRVPTGALVGIELDVDRWADAGPGGGQLAFLLPPRLFDHE